jgi:hypothetical protein
MNSMSARLELELNLETGADAPGRRSGVNPPEVDRSVSDAAGAFIDDMEAELTY